MFFEVCTDCGRDFPQYQAWQTRCYRCYNLFKQKHKRREKPPEVEWGNPFAGNGLFETAPTERHDRGAAWLRANIKELLHLCHPDKHDGSEQSNKITRELIKIFKER